MAEYQLYCFAQSGNAYRCRADAQPHRRRLGADLGRFLRQGRAAHAGVPRQRQRNGRGAGAGARQQEAQPVRRDPDLSRRPSGKFRPRRRGRAARGAALDHLRQPEGQWLSRAVSLPAIFAKPPGDPAVLAFLKGRIDNNLAIVDKRLSSRPFVLGARPTIADLSLVGYLYYPAEEFGFDIAAQHKHIAAWLDRIKALPGWKHPYDLMPGYPLPGGDCSRRPAGQRAVRPPSMANSAPVTKLRFVGETDRRTGPPPRRAGRAARAGCRARSGRGRPRAVRSAPGCRRPSRLRERPDARSCSAPAA